MFGWQLCVIANRCEFFQTDTTPKITPKVKFLMLKVWQRRTQIQSGLGFQHQGAEELIGQGLILAHCHPISQGPKNCTRKKV